MKSTEQYKNIIIQRHKYVLNFHHIKRGGRSAGKSFRKKSRCCPLLIMSIMPNQLSQKEEKKPDIIKRGYRDTSASERIVEGLKKEASKQASKNKYSQKTLKERLVFNSGGGPLGKVDFDRIFV